MQRAAEKFPTQKGADTCSYPHRTCQAVGLFSTSPSLHLLAMFARRVGLALLVAALAGADGSVGCFVSEWTEWSDCSYPCGTGAKTRTRTVQGGVKCGHTKEMDACNTDPCADGSTGMSPEEADVRANLVLLCRAHSRFGPFGSCRCVSFQKAILVH